MMTAFGYSAPKQMTKRTLIYEVAELLVEEKADVGRLRRAGEAG